MRLRIRKIFRKPKLKKLLILVPVTRVRLRPRNSLAMETIYLQKIIRKD